MNQPIQVFWKTQSEVTNEFLTNLVIFPLVILMCIGLVYSVNAFVPDLLRKDLGILPIIIIPVAVLVTGFFLLMFMACSLSIQHISMKLGYSAVIAYFAVPLLIGMGIFGKSDASLYILYALTFGLALIFFTFMSKKKSTLKIVQWVLGIGAGIPALYILAYTTTNLAYSAGWISQDRLLPLPI